MPIYCVHGNVFIIFLALCGLSSAACLDSTCASSPESDVGAKASLLQQNALRSAPAQDYEAQGEAHVAQLHHSFKEAEEARLRAEVLAEAARLGLFTADKARLEVEKAGLNSHAKKAKVKSILAGMKAFLKFGSGQQEQSLEAKLEAKLKPKEEAQLGADVLEALNLQDRELEKVLGADLLAERLKATPKRLKAADMEEETIRKIEELIKSKNAEEAKPNAEKADALRKAQTETRLRAFRMAKAEKEAEREVNKTLNQGSAQIRQETKLIAKPADEKSALGPNLVALKPEHMSNVSLPNSEAFVVLKSEREGLTGAAAAAETAKSAAAAAKAEKANAVTARREAEIKAAAAQLAVKKATEANGVAAEAVKRVAEVQGVQGDPKNYVNSALIDRTHKVIMGWTPRAACTATVHMFLLSAGMYTPKDEERFPWVHDYREALGDWLKPQIADMNNPKFTKFKIVRNPYTRAISNWGHQMETNFSYSSEFQELAAANGVSERSNFLEWLRFVQKVGNFKEFRKERLDQHSWPQFSNWEKMGGRYDVIIQLEEPGFKDKLDQINNRHNSKLLFKTMHVSLAQDQNSSKLPTDAPSFYNNTSERPPFASELYGVRAEPRSPSHKPEQLYTQFPEAIKLVEEIYADDFDAYGYPKDVTKVYEH